MKKKEQQDINNIHMDAQIKLSQDKTEILIQKNKLTKVIKHYCDFTYVQLNVIVKPIKIMNLNIYEDVMSYIANIINQQDLDIVISQQHSQFHNEGRLPNYLLKYSIVFDLNYKNQEQITEQIGELLIQIGEKLEKLCYYSYQHGDENLEGQVLDLINEFKPKIMNTY